MVCKKCKNIISESSLKCPYCGTAISEDYFGYQRAENAIRMQNAQPRKKDNSGKIILIVLSAVGGVFAIICMLLLMFALPGGTSNTAGSQYQTSYDASFEVNNSFLFSVSDDVGNSYSVTVRSLSNNGFTDRFTMPAGTCDSKNYQNGTYEVYVMRSFSERLILEMTVSDTSSFTSVDVDFDDRQIVVLANDGTSEIVNGSANENAGSNNTGSQPPDTNNTPDADSGSGVGGGSDSDSSSGNNTYLELTGSKYVNTKENGYNETISYQKYGDGYKMIIDRNDCDSTEYTAYFNSDKLITSVTINSMGDISERTYSYNNKNQLVNETIEFGEGEGYLIQYSYDSSGNLIKFYRTGTRGMAIEQYFEYSGPQLIKMYYASPSETGSKYEYQDGLLSKITNYNTSTNEIYTEQYYTYNSMMQVLSFKEIIYPDNANPYTGNSLTYTYDGSRLVKIDGFSNYIDSSREWTDVYTYDSNDNIIKIETDATDYTSTNEFTYDYISTDFAGLLDEFCMKVHDTDADSYYFNIGSDF